ncbi:Uncharacterised protein [Mycobacteroides abscessus]|nr:Uncharacterised protein [Mycobacteroides abscessus]
MSSTSDARRASGTVSIWLSATTMEPSSPVDFCR